MNSRYDHIIELPHHISKRHPPMPRANRAAQFSPFAALTGFDVLTTETTRQTDERKVLDDDELAILNSKINILTKNLSQRPEAEIRYFVPDRLKSGGSVQTAIGNIRVIEPVGRVIILTDGKRISLDDILDISSPLFADLDQ